MEEGVGGDGGKERDEGEGGKEAVSLSASCACVVRNSHWTCSGECVDGVEEARGVSEYPFREEKEEEAVEDGECTRCRKEEMDVEGVLMKEEREEPEVTADASESSFSCCICDFD